MASSLTWYVDLRVLVEELLEADSQQPAVIGFNHDEGLFLAPYNVSGPNQTVADQLSYQYFWCPATKTTK